MKSIYFLSFQVDILSISIGCDAWVDIWSGKNFGVRPQIQIRIGRTFATTVSDEEE